MRVKRVLAGKLSKVLDFEVSSDDIEVPEEEEFGDLAFPLMGMVEEPREVAEEVVSSLEELDVVERVEVAGPGYVNVFLDREVFFEGVVEMMENGRKGVEEREGELLIEFSSPNVAKPMHVGHFRNNALGDSLQRVFRFVGYDVTSENYLGDWGTQYGKLIQAFKEFGSRESFEEEPMEHLFGLYVRFHDEAEEDEEMEEKGREWARKIEEGDEEAVELWEMFREASIEYHRKDYERMDVHFDRWTGESEVVEGSRDMVEGWIEEGLLERGEDGSVFIEFEDLPGTVLLKADGSTLYLTRDLYNLEKRNEEGFDFNLYVVASEQDLHFMQLFEAAETFGLETEGSEHVSYGLLDLPEGSMSSREGNIVRMSDLMDEAVERARGLMEEEGKEEDIAEEVGIGAVKYAVLSVSRKKNISFEWENMLTFEGNSGPYLQYSNTRARSIIEKAGGEGKASGGMDDVEYSLLKEVARFPEKVEAAADRREPSILAHYLIDLCEEFNTFYHRRRVIDAGERERERRLKLVELFEQVSGEGINLLGIKTLEEM